MNSAIAVSDRFTMALAGLFGAVAARVRSGAMTGVMILLVCRRVRRIEGQVLRLLARFRAGTLRVGPEVGRVAGRAPTAPVRRAAMRLPLGFGWLLPLVPCEAANFASQVRLALVEPELAALLAASPRARAVLAPLCRMLAIEPAVLAGDASLVEAGSEEALLEVRPCHESPGLAARDGASGQTPLAPDCPPRREGLPAQGPPLPDAG
jgi:hypothetical protein